MPSLLLIDPFVETRRWVLYAYYILKFGLIYRMPYHWRNEEERMKQRFCHFIKRHFNAPFKWQRHANGLLSLLRFDQEPCGLFLYNCRFDETDWLAAPNLIWPKWDRQSAKTLWPKTFSCRHCRLSTSRPVLIRQADKANQQFRSWCFYLENRIVN